jgi:hypothetical protein
VSALAVQRVGGDQASGEVGQAAQGGGKCGDLVAVGDRGLGEHQPAGVVVDADQLGLRTGSGA